MYFALSIACLLILLFLLEYKNPLHAQALKKKTLLVSSFNLGFGLLNFLVNRFAFVPLLIFIETQIAWQGLLPLFIESSLILGMVSLLLFDMWQYFWHRILHRVPFFWRFHAVHHADEAMNVTTATRFHLGEILLSNAMRLVILTLTGIPLWVVVLYESLSLPVILLHHSNIKLSERLERLLGLVFVLPKMHWVHHSSFYKQTDSNFSSFFSIWDRIFGTYVAVDSVESLNIGLNKKAWNPEDNKNILRLFARPFIPQK